MSFPPTLRAADAGNGDIHVYSGSQILLTLSADVVKAVARVILLVEAVKAVPPVPGWEEAFTDESRRKRLKKSAKEAKASKKPKKIKAAKPAIKAPPFHLARRSALSPSKTNLFRGSVSTP